jgi:hypothetical protein
MIYTVRVNGQPIKNFNNIEDAKKYQMYLATFESTQNLISALIEGALLNSDMKEAKEVINHIMEKKSEN